MRKEYGWKHQPAVPIHKRRVWETMESLGPRHDPYSRTRINVQENHRVFSFVSCALAGEEWVEVDGRRVPNVWNVFDLFFLLTGLYPDQWVKIIQKRYEPDPMGSLAEYV